MADSSSSNQQPEFVAPPVSNGPTYRAAAMVADNIDVLSKPVDLASLQFSQNVSVKKTATASLTLTLAPVTPRVTTTSVAPEKPFHVTNTSFVVKVLSYDEIQAKITSVLSNIIDYDFSYIPDKFQWICKAVQGANLREYNVNCYWDAINEEHVVEVLKVRAGGLNLNFADLFEALLIAFNDHNRSIQAPPRKRTLSPLPLRSSSASVALSNEQFLAGIQSIFVMAQEHFYEPKLEAAKMLCELAKRSRSYLELEECVTNCVTALENLMKDDVFDEVRSLAILAFADFVELPVYQAKFCERHLLPTVLSLVDNCPLDSMSFDCAHLRRKAADSIATISKNFPDAAVSALSCSGFANEEEWMQHVDKLKDGRIRSSSMRIAQCYNMSPVSVAEGSAIY